MKKVIALGLMLMFLVLPVNASGVISKFDPRGDDSYNLILENNQGLIYNFPFITNEDNIFKYGDDKYDFVFIEGRINNGSTITADKPMLFNVGMYDFFLLSDMKKAYDENATSHVFRYSGIDVFNRTISFLNTATSTDVQLAYENSTIPGVLGETYLVASGDVYKVYISENDTSLAIDMNADDKVDRQEIRFTIATGEIYDLGNAEQSDNNDIINKEYVWVMLGTKQNLFGYGLPKTNEKVFIKIIPKKNEVVWIKSVIGGTFKILNQGFFRTYYNETFDLWKGAGDVNELTITSP
jgi:hypothetical protein